MRRLKLDRVHICCGLLRFIEEKGGEKRNRDTNLGFPMAAVGAALYYTRFNRFSG